LLCFFVTDIHGKLPRYRKLFARIAAERPRAVFLGGDLLPMHFEHKWVEELGPVDFVEDFLAGECRKLTSSLGPDYPRIFLILGNDDPRAEEDAFTRGTAEGLWECLHLRRADCEGYPVFGYACVPPTPFLLKDWERYDVSRYVDPGCVSPEEGRRSVPVPEHETRHATIQDDLAQLVGKQDLARAIFLFHSPPYDTNLDRASLDGKKVDGVPLDLHIGSIAIQRFIQERQPLLTLHGHVHESTRLTGVWHDRIGRTHCLNGAHDGPELSLVRFDPEHLDAATRNVY
jgi:Icc-related predicted phosphoesterase